ncbi:hypothetical protein [Sorangium sp. So ce1389]|uniref:hypothetical protein n=1 Tax=Sorangium sp. So ce1389 TaxID=3133336 RepID=UPI003F61840A
MSAIQDAMNALNSQWYNVLTQQAQLDPSTFQLVQGNMPVGTTSEQLWSMFDAVPPRSVSTFYEPGQISSFSQNYVGVISALLAQGQLQLAADMGDYYTQWNDYKKTISPLPQDNAGWYKAFSTWASANLPQSMVQRAISDFATMLEDPIATAADTLIQVSFAPKNPSVYVYTTTYEQLQQALNKAQPKTVSMNSETESTDVSHTWAKTEASGLFDIFAGEGNASYEQWTSQVIEAGLSIEVSFDKLVTLEAGPLKQKSSDAVLRDYTPWFNSGALGEGYANKDNTVWKSGDAITWDSTFGANGNLQRYAAALVIVDGITMTMKSSAGIAQGSQEEFKAAVSAGVWPFFEAHGEGGWSNEATFDDSGNVTITSTCKAGNPQILGIIVLPITSIFS